MFTRVCLSVILHKERKQLFVEKPMPIKQTNQLVGTGSPKPRGFL